MKTLTVLALLFSTGTFAADVNIKNARVRLLPPTSTTTAAFMTLENTTNKEIKLVKAHSEVCQTTELHNHFKVDGMMKMREVPSISIPANGKRMLKPGSFHIMLINLKKPLKLGQKVKINLSFEDGKKMEIYPIVKKIHKMKH